MATGVITVEKTIAANSTDPNILSGSNFQLPQAAQVVSGGVTAAATGLVMSLQAGARTLQEESACFVKTNFPVVPDEMFYNFSVIPNEQLICRVRNTTGAGIVVRAIFQVQDA